MLLDTLFFFVPHQVKCVQYWPDTGSQNYGKITVSMELEQVKADYVIRKLKVIKVRILPLLSTCMTNVEFIE